MKYLFIIFAILIACNKPRPEAETVHLVNSESSITKLSRPTQRFGIGRLDQISRTRNKVIYAFSGQVTGTFTYEQQTENQLRLILQKGSNTTTLICNKVKKNMIYEEKGIDLLAENSGAASMREASLELSLEEQTEIANTLTLYNELTMEDLERVDVDLDLDLDLDRRLCRRTAISVRISKSSSVDHLNSFVDNYLGSHRLCSREHGVDSGCLWGDYACVSTQSIVCSC